MKPRSIRSLLLVPSLIIVLLPFLACLVFNLSAKNHAHEVTCKELESMQTEISGLITECFSEDKDRQLHAFLGKINHFATVYPGRARLFIYSNDYTVLYPRCKDAGSEIKNLATQFADALREDAVHTGDYFQDADGQRYLIQVNPPPESDDDIGHIVTYIPESQIGIWVRAASIEVLVISALLCVLALLALWRASSAIRRPLNQLCSEAKRIGAGNFDPIDPDFAVREAEELRLAMNAMSEHLRRTDASKQDLMDNISHQLRIPLMSIVGYAQGIEQGVFDDPAKAAGTIVAESSRLTGVLNGLLTLSRLESPLMQPALSAIPTAEIARELLDNEGIALQHSDIRTRFEAEGSDLTAMGDRELLATVLDNLLSNAARYAKTEIVLSVRSEDERIRIAVADDGLGLAEEDIPHLFDRFYKGKDGHFGLGLTIARSAAAQMGGALTAANRPEGGAIFTLSLNRCDPADPGK